MFFPQNPASTKVRQVAVQVSSTGSVTCSKQEKASLRESQKNLRKAAAKLARALAAIQKDLLSKKTFCNVLIVE